MNTSGKTIVSIKNLVKTYIVPNSGVSVAALSGINLDIFPGEFVAITGHSGSGKSTLLHQIGLLDEPTSGNILINNKDVSSFTESARTEFRLHFLSFVFQFFNLVEHYSALENIVFQLRLQGYDARASELRAREILSFLGLVDRADLLPRELSGGEQQRIAIGRALAKDSLLLIADEPTAHLDTRNAAIVMDLLKYVNQKFGKTIILVTHEPDEAQQANRIVELRDGRIAN